MLSMAYALQYIALELRSVVEEKSASLTHYDSLSIFIFVLLIMIHLISCPPGQSYPLTTAHGGSAPIYKHTNICDRPRLSSSAAWAGFGAPHKDPVAFRLTYLPNCYLPR